MRKLQNRVSKLEKLIAELERKRPSSTRTCVPLDPERPHGHVDMAYQFEKVQTACRTPSTIGVHHHRIGTTPVQGMNQWLHGNGRLDSRP